MERGRLRDCVLRLSRRRRASWSSDARVMLVVAYAAWPAGRVGVCGSVETGMCDVERGEVATIDSKRNPRENTNKEHTGIETTVSSMHTHMLP